MSIEKPVACPDCGSHDVYGWMLSQNSTATYTCQRCGKVFDAVSSLPATDARESSNT